MAHDVFISYSSKDKAIADAACGCMESRGIRCWMAPRDIVAGADWSESIIDGISGARAMILVLSSHSNMSKQVLREIERAVSRGIPVLPFRVEDVVLSKSLEYFLSSAHWLDAYQGPLKHNLERLANNAAVVVEKQEAVRPLSEPSPAPPRKAERGSSSLLVPMGVCALAAVVLTVVAARNFLDRPGPSHQAAEATSTASRTSPSAGSTQPRIAVLPFAELSEGTAETSGYARGIGRVMNTRFQESGLFSLVDRDRLDAVLAELKLSRSAEFDPSTAARVGKLLGARQLVLGSFFQFGKKMRLDASFIDTETAEVLCSAGSDGPPEDIEAITQALCDDLIVKYRALR